MAPKTSTFFDLKTCLGKSYRHSIGHWTRWCPVPLIVALSILRPARCVDNIGQSARMGVKHAVTCTLVLASLRRLLRQEGAFLHQKCSDPKDVLWWITTLHEIVATDSHIELGVEFPTRTWAMGCCPPSKYRLKKCCPWTTALSYFPC